MNLCHFRNFLHDNNFPDDFVRFLTKINYIILQNYRRQPNNSLQNVIYEMEHHLLVNNCDTLTTQQIVWFEDYFGKITRLSMREAQYSEHKDYYDREFEF